MVWCDIVWHYMGWYGVFNMVCFDIWQQCIKWYGVVWYDVGWYLRPCSLWAMDGARLDDTGCKAAKSHCRQCYASDTNGSEETFLDTQWRKVKHECYASDTNGSEETFENTYWRNVKHECYASDTNGSEDTFENTNATVMHQIQMTPILRAPLCSANKE